MTLRDVAHRAGVSPSTVSLVFSGKGPVAASTAERVRAAAAELGWLGPDPRAVSLRTGRVGVVGVIVEGRIAHALRDPFALRVLDGLTTELERHGSAVLLHAQDPRRPESSLPALAAQPLDAVVLPYCGTRDNPVIAALLARSVPVVASVADTPTGVVHVCVDEAAAMARVTAYLRELGHRRIATVTLPLSPDPASGFVAEAVDSARRYVESHARLEGFRRAGGDQALAVEAAHPGSDAGAAAADLLLNLPSHRRPTAIAAQSDLLAAGVVQAVRDRGLRIPEDISVTGFDGVDLPWLGVSLTTLVQPAEDKGRRLARLALECAEGRHPSSQELSVHLRVGVSTSPPAPA